MTRVVPPVTEPDVTLMAVTVGGGTINVNLSEAEIWDVPLED